MHSKNCQPKPQRMKQILLSLASGFLLLSGTAQTATTGTAGRYEAAHWDTKLVSREIRIAPPAAGAQQQAELKAVKQRMAKVDDRKMEAIRFWNAGAPSYRWNQIAPQLISQKPDAFLRMPTAWINLALYDATIIAWKEKLRYKKARPHQVDPSLKPLIDAPLTYSYPCEHSVTAAAAAYTLAYFFPDKADSIMEMGKAAAQSRIDAGVQFPGDVAAGWQLGEQVAQQVIEKAKMDGSAKVWDGQMNKDPKKWTGPFPLGITMATMLPIALNTPGQFRPPPPPDFEPEMKQLREFKQNFKSKSLAFYWANNGGFEYWSDVAAKKMFEYRIMDDAPLAARIYTVLHTAYHDVAIAIMDAKYAYWGIRPAQYDTTFKPLIATPPFPGYPSGHAAGAATTSTVLAYFFPADAREFRQYAQECADSRFYAGIHFRSDNEAGLKMGTAVGKYIAENWMKKEPKMSRK